MSATQQTQVNALVRAQLQLLLDEIHQLKQECKLLAETRDAYANNHNERLKKLEANAAAATRPSPASTRRLSTAMENTIRRSSREQLADLVIGLCNRDDATQKAAVSLLLDGEGDAQMSTSSTSINTLLPSDPPPSKRRASRAFSTTTKTCKNCKEKYNPDNMRRSEDDECWYHPGRREIDDEAEFWDNEPYTDWQGRRMSGFVPFEEGMGMIWTCCAQDGRTDGCERGEHEALDAGSAASRKRLRW